MLPSTSSTSISTFIFRYHTKHKLHRSLLYCSSSSSIFFFFFFFFFLNGFGDAVDQPIRFQSPLLPSINETISYNWYDQDGDTKIWGKVWPIHKIPAIANMSDIFGDQASTYAILCYVNTSQDAFFLSIILADNYTVSENIIAYDNDLLGTLSSVGRIIWMANRNKPMMGGIPKLQLEEEEAATLSNNKSLVLRGGDDEVVWRANAGNAPTIELRGDGNFVIMDKNTKSVVWQSFDHPTDTLVPGQTLRLGQRLVSRTSATNFSEGSFFMEKVHHGFSLFYKGSSFLLPYYSWYVEGCPDTYLTITRYTLSVGCDKSTTTYDLSAHTSSTPILRLEFSGDFNIKGEQSTPITRRCDVPNNCGAYLTCSGESCSSHCETSDFKEDCKPSQNGPSLFDSCSNPSLVSKMGKLHNISYFPSAYPEQIHMNVSNSEECETMCYGNCTCAASFYNLIHNTCTLMENVLQFTATKNSVGFIKMFKTVSTVLYIPPSSPTTKRGLNQRNIIFLAIGATVAFLLLCVAPGTFLVHRRWTTNSGSGSESDVSDDGFLEAFQASLFTRFSYKDIQTITNNFTKKLGSGGFGSVFEGVLPNSSKAAVKRLDGISQQGAKEFRAEVAILANIHHFNLVKLLDFCAHGSQRMLIYEHMPNGSLDAWLFRDLALTWTTRYMIAIGVASGLAYLHEERDDKVIHLDIKPQNILLDQNFVAKVGDFGMSRLMNRGESFAYTTMRGTPGYLAPEWLLHGAANEKMDVYSFGMVLLELISGRKNYKPEIMEEDKCYFPAWAFKKVMEGQELEMLDHKLLSSLHNSEELKQIRTLIRVSFICIQDDAHNRPRMSLVVKMLEGEAPLHPLPLNQHMASLTTRIIKLENIIGDSNSYTLSSALSKRQS